MSLLTSFLVYTIQLQHKINHSEMMGLMAALFVKGTVHELILICLLLFQTLQNFMYTMLRDTNVIAAKKSLDVMVELYRKNIWNDAKTVNVLTTACFSSVTKVSVSLIFTCTTYVCTSISIVR